MQTNKIASMKEKVFFAVVRVRGKMKIKASFKHTLNLLHLYRQNTCIVVPNQRQILGMLIKTKDYITWGEINEETFKQLLAHKGKIAGNKKLTESYLKEKAGLSINEFTGQFFAGKKRLNDIPGMKEFFRLSPPLHGWESLKKDYSIGGSLGYRGEAINELIKRMLH